jgi:ribosomal protein S18
MTTSRVQRVYRNIQEIATEYEQARAAAHEEYYYSLRDSDAAEMLEETLSRIDYSQTRELSKFLTVQKAVASRRRELRAA